MLVSIIMARPAHHILPPRSACNRNRAMHRHSTIQHSERTGIQRVGIAARSRHHRAALNRFANLHLFLEIVERSD